MWYRLIIELLIVLYFIYIITILLQLYGIVSFTNRKMTFKRMIIPFYYWIAPTNENSKNKNKNEDNKN